MKDLKKIQEFFSKPLEEAELKLGVKYGLPNGDTGYIMTGGSNDPRNWIFSAKKVPYLSVKKELKPLATQPGKYDGAFDLGLGKGHHIDERMDDEDFDSLEDAIANREFGMDYNQLGPNEKEWVRDEMSMNERIDFDEALNLRAIKVEIEDEIIQLRREMEDEGDESKANYYGGKLNKLEDKLAKVKKQLDDYDMNESVSKSKMPTQSQVDRFFTLTQNETHYLNSKPVAGQEKTPSNMEVEPWDEYDLSNWNALVKKARQRGKSTIAEAKKMTLGNYLDDLDSRFVDFMRAADGKNAKGSQGIDMLATLYHNFNLFRNYISSIKKEYSSELNKELTFSIDEAKEEDKIDIITMDVPLFIRALEYAKEDAQEDMDLHDFAERAIAATKEQGILQMDDYDMLVGGKEPMDESYITEASVPSNIKEFAKRKGVTALVNKVAGWAEKVGARISGGTAVGYNYSTLVLDMKYQAGEIRINTDNDTIKLYNTPVNSFPEFKEIYDEENPIDKKKTNENVAQTLAEIIKLGKDVIEEELCPAGKAYIKRRQAAGEKSSAYLSGRAVKVCKGQMSGTSKKKTNESLINKDQKPTQKLDNLLNKIKKDFNIDNE